MSQSSKNQNPIILFIKIYVSILILLFIVSFISTGGQIINLLIKNDIHTIQGLAISTLILTILVFTIFVIIQTQKSKKRNDIGFKSINQKNKEELILELEDYNQTNHSELSDVLDLERWSLAEDSFYDLGFNYYSNSNDTKVLSYQSDAATHYKIDPIEAQNRAFSAPHYYLGDYIPKWTNAQDEFSQLILLFKNLTQLPYVTQKDLIEYFVNKLVSVIKEKEINANVIIPIPSSRAYVIGKGHIELCRQVARLLGIEDGTGILNRIKTIQKSSISPSKSRPSYNEHYDSIKVAPWTNLEGKRVVLFDDVYTTGNTARAAAHKIFEAGAERVWIITLGKTKVIF
ncbi:hypothetical protein DRP05_04035 [Archaeoglobales archaeon]|nr:MAG: hypothetical protein DRP05_04035 [Archaeoglobales archaeon]